MSLVEILLIALGLSMDSFAVSMTSGALLARSKVRHCVRIALYMGFFQGFMPFLGWLAGVSFQGMIQQIDHWVAFGLLAIIGGKMFWEGIKKRKGAEEKGFDPTCRLTLLGLAVATSIDALAVGVTFAMLRIDLLAAILIISFTTFVLSLAGTAIGARYGRHIKLPIEIIGGLILIGIGTKILFEHLY